MKPLFAATIFVAAVLMFQSCGPSLTITSDYDHAANVAQYKTFMILQPDNQHQTLSALNHDRIYNAVRDNMISKGFQEAANADLAVNIIAIVKNEQSLQSNSYGGGGYYRPYAYGGGFTTTTTTVENTKTGSLIIDVIDAKANKMIWTATGNQNIDQPLSDPTTQIPPIINKIMASFPPGAAKPK
jgi:Domain of unknown function (DUF4136)